jgi:hypothetical protein
MFGPSFFCYIVYASFIVILDRFAKLCVQFASIGMHCYHRHHTSRSHTIIHCLQLAHFNLKVFLYYDYALTLSSEIKYIWLGKLRPTTFLYMGCRFALIGNMVFLLTLFNILDKSVFLQPTQIYV